MENQIATIENKASAIMDNTSAIGEKAFDFEKNAVERMSLQTLKRTHKENDIYGQPVRGIYHYQVIDKITQICDKYNLNYEVEEIFAAQNKNKNMPGVVILPQVEEQFGEKAIEAHVLRRVYTTINIRNWETDELTTTLAIAYHQDGIQCAIGPCVKICHNQCVLGAERSACNYGKWKVTTAQLFDTVDNWLKDFETYMNADREKIKRMKETVVSAEQVYIVIGMLTALRVAHDSRDRRLSEQVETYPLNQSQISIFTEELLKARQEKAVITAWDIYNIATEIYKPMKSDFPTLIPQNVAFVNMIENFLN